MRLILSVAFLHPLLAESNSSLITDEAARVELARMLRDDERIEESIAEYLKLIEVEPKRADLRLELANIYAASNRPDAALDVLAPLPIEALGPGGQRLVANLAVQKGDFSRAEKLLRSYLAENPDDLTVRLQLADVLSWTARYDASIAEFTTLVNARPDDIQLRRRFARVLGWAGRRADAITQWKLSLKASKSAP